jgi:hypothetical protein
MPPPSKRRCKPSATNTATGMRPAAMAVGEPIRPTNYLWADDRWRLFQIESAPVVR